MLKQYLAKVINSEDLSQTEAEEAMGIIMRGDATQAQIGGFLVGLRMKGETVDEITGSARAMRNHSEKINLSKDNTPLIDTAGTGGDGSHSFNISTAAAFVIAGSSVNVAKHGNRAASSKCGSADVLYELGVNIDLVPEQVAECINRIGIGFLFAPQFHPAMKNAIGPRKEIGQRTIFNLLGPLTNPAGATHQIIGVYDPKLIETIARVSGNLGTAATMVVHGFGSIDELSTNGPNNVSNYIHGKLQSSILDPADLHLRPCSAEKLTGGDPIYNAEILENLLNGKDKSAREDIVLFNAAAALSLIDGDIGNGIKLAKESLTSGAALQKLRDLASVTQQIATRTSL